MSSNKDLFVILHNIRSCYNVGSIFRTAESLGVKKIFLTGYTPNLTNAKNFHAIGKTALGAEKNIPCENAKNISKIIQTLKAQKVKIIALEQAPNSQNLFDFKNDKSFPLALILGNEVRGISPALLKKVDEIVEIPMLGKKESLNVSVAFGIAGYQLIFGK